ncbi:MAG: YggS family pyridoxal phosphate-dependent enzyme [Dehalococcoidia bacterium]|nr:YggS family pyridoxal phosphate-dependent enzyme [Dehalococcoidia bacterium]
MTLAPGTIDAIGARLAQVRERMAAACARAGRKTDSVTLVGVTKTFSAETVAAAYDAGLRDFGENYVQEALEKIAVLRHGRPEIVLGASGTEPARFHFIGHMQSNKVKTALTAFEALHGIDSESALDAIAATAPTHAVRIFLQVNIAREASKRGALPDEVRGLLLRAQQMRVEVLGLMAIPPRSENAEDARTHFHRLREMAERHRLKCLSMGMSDDFEVAIEEGATHIRVGRAIFGERSG